MSDIRIKQKDLVGHPFSIEKETVLSTYKQWDANTRKMSVGRFKEGTFEVYSKQLGQWVSAEYDREAGWKKQFVRQITLVDEVSFDNAFDAETKQGGSFTTNSAKVTLTAGVEKQLQERIEDEKRRGSSFDAINFVLEMKKTGDTPMDVEYTLRYHSPRPKPDAPNGASSSSLPEIPEEEINDDEGVAEVVDHVKFAFNALIEQYRAQLISQIKKGLDDKQISSISPAEVLEQYFLK